MSRLLTTLFLPYGRVGKSPAVSNGRWGWLNYCYLDPSFKFLLKKPQGIPQEIVDQELRFLAFFAGYFDAEGNLRISQDEKRAAYYLRINSEDETILRQAAHALRAMGYHAYFRLLTRPSAKNHYKKSLWSFGMFRKQEVLDLLPKLPLLHDEKIRWKALMLESREEGWDSLKSKTIALRSSIKAEVRRYCELARAAKELAAER